MAVKRPVKTTAVKRPVKTTAVKRPVKTTAVKRPALASLQVKRPSLASLQGRTVDVDATPTRITPKREAKSNNPYCIKYEKDQAADGEDSSNRKRKLSGHNSDRPTKTLDPGGKEPKGKEEKQKPQGFA
ncbi:hypothetical protein SARC_06634 [Sphaeroforma arctica JP610]|uniref:Uncharacterized protein n=1 Tax=Sphaeroforma arctica JP610 TaxID=667725 RepID=A0A0L0FVZ8_9EUKA|nr:hypothetical protein SARC_06634 [Sphaeroforma arctica JP610]KNC81020.1 hypothetical protein SARC_06634 [Sphaeroforma arctica JP610]|eukprot:XP_014154922.1 hypothetical protein SARC_06634 [Sphaeroforma arctica JP610]